MFVLGVLDNGIKFAKDGGEVQPLLSKLVPPLKYLRGIFCTSKANNDISLTLSELNFGCI
jgi:hypothetical protein